MLSFKEFILETILNTDKQKEFFKQQIKNFKPERYNKLFNLFKDKPGYYLTRKNQRLFFPLEKPTKLTKPLKVVIKFIEEKGFDIVDYITGEIVKKDNPGAKNKIQAVLSKYKSPLESEYIKNSNIIKQEIKSQDTDLDNYLVCITRFPADIIGMSFNREWSTQSCMNIEQYAGVYAEQYLPADIKEGTLVAYLIHKDDKVIDKPVARISLRPYISIGGKKQDSFFGMQKAEKSNEKLNIVDDVHAFQRATKTYYERNDSGRPVNIIADKYIKIFEKSVDNWIKIVHKDFNIFGDFEIKQNLYNQESKQSFKINSKELINIKKEIKKDINNINNYSDETKLQYIENLKNFYDLPKLFKHIKNPSESLQKKVIQIFGSIIEHIENPSEDMQLLSIKDNAYNIEHIKNPTEKVKMTAVKQTGEAIEFIDNPSEELQIAAIKQNNRAIRFIKNPSDKIKKLAGI